LASDKKTIYCLKRQFQLSVWQFGRSFEGVIKPVPEVVVGKQVQTKESRQATQRQIAFGTELEILEQQDD